MHRTKTKGLRTWNKGYFSCMLTEGYLCPTWHECVTHSSVLNWCLEEFHSLLLFLTAIPLESLTALCRRAWFLSPVAEAASRSKKIKKNTDCKYILHKETYIIKRSGWTQLADCLLILHHSRAYRFSNHYLDSWNTKLILHKHCMEKSFRRIRVLYQSRITKTLQSALLGFCVKIQLKSLCTLCLTQVELKKMF